MAKRFDIQETPFGICSDPNVLKAPQGALSECLNCEIKRDGVIQPITGLDKVSTSGATLSYVTRLYNFDDDLLLFDSVGNFFEFLGNLGNELQDEDSGYPDFFENYWNVQEARGNLYVACDDGVRKVTGSDSTDLFVAGLMPDIYGYVDLLWDNSDYNWFTNAYFLKYTSTVVRKDANDVVVESPPSSPTIVENNAPGARVPRYIVYLGASIQAGDIIKVYRTTEKTSAAATGFTFYFTKEHTVTSTDISNKYALFYDYKPDNELGVELYTNPGQEGNEKRNYRPPVAKVISSYNNSTFYSNVIEPSRINLSFVSATSNLAGASTGAGNRQVTASWVSGSAALTGVSDPTGIEVGQLITGSAVPDDTYVISIVGNIVTMSNNATATGSGNVGFHDTITFGYDSTYETYAVTQGLTTNYTANVGWLILNIIQAQSVRYFAEITEIVYNHPNQREFFSVERKALNSSTFYVWATHGEAYDPVLSGPTYSGGFVFSTDDGLESDMLTKPNREYWSKSDQPEHVPITNWHDIGDSSAIIQSVTTKDGRIVFKDDGIYTVTGSGAYSGWSQRLLDKENVLVTSGAAIAVGNVVYAITNRGFVAVDVHGVAEISRPYINYEAGENRAANTDATLSKAIMSLIYDRRAGTATSGCWVSYDQNNNRVLFTIPYTSSYALDIWVYNLDTKVFSRINYGDDTIWYALPNTSDDGTLYVAGTNIGESGILYKDNGVYCGLYERSRTVSAKPDSTTIDFTAAHNASVGDIITDGSGRAEVLTVVDSDTVTVDDNSGISGACKIYTPFQSVVRWRPRFGSSRMFMKNFVAYEFMFSTLSEYSASTGDVDEYEIDFQYGGSSYGPLGITKTSARGLVPASEARVHSIEPAIYISAVKILWALVGMSLEYYSQAPRGTK